MNSLTLIRLDLQAKQPGEGFPVFTIVNLPRSVSLEEKKSCSYPALSWRSCQRAWYRYAVSVVTRVSS